MMTISIILNDFHNSCDDIVRDCSTLALRWQIKTILVYLERGNNYANIIQMTFSKLYN